MKHYSRCPHCTTVNDLSKQKTGLLKSSMRCVSCNKKFDFKKNILSEEEVARYLQLEKKLSSVVKRVDLKLDNAEESFNKNIELLENTPSEKLTEMKQDVEEVVSELDELVDEKFFKRDKEEIDYIKSAQGKHQKFKQELKKEHEKKNKKKDSEFKFQLLDDDAYEKKNKPKTKISLLNALGFFFGLLICAALVALFMFQLYMRNQSQWHNSENLRPIVEKVAALMGETIEEQKDVKQFNLLSTSMLPHPKIDNAVIIQVQLINKAEFSQPYPWFEVSITNVNGKVLARRNVAPRDYLLTGQSQQKIKSKEFKKINIQMLALPKAADGYEIRLLNK